SREAVRLVFLRPLAYIRPGRQRGSAADTFDLKPCPRRGPMAQLARPVIGINADFIPAGKVNRAHMRLNAGYFDAVLAAGGLPIVMPPLGKEPEIADFLEHVSGFVLCGGLDLDPLRNGMPGHASVQPMAQRREESDRVLVRMLMERQLPTLGI